MRVEQNTTLRFFIIFHSFRTGDITMALWKKRSSFDMRIRHVHMLRNLIIVVCIKQIYSSVLRFWGRKRGDKLWHMVRYLEVRKCSLCRDLIRLKEYWLYWVGQLLLLLRHATVIVNEILILNETRLVVHNLTSLRRDLIDLSWQLRSLRWLSA